MGSLICIAVWIILLILANVLCPIQDESHAMQEYPNVVLLRIRKHILTSFLALLVASLILAASHNAMAGFVYSYSKVADSNQLPSSPVVLNNIDIQPQINNNKQVALLFRQSSNGIQGGTTNSSAIYRWNSGALTRIAGTGDVVPSNGSVQFLSRPALSDSGSIGFRTSYTISGAGVLRVPGTSNTIQVLSSDTNTLNPIAMNANDRLVTSIRPSLPINGPYDVVSWDASGANNFHASNSSSGTFSSFSA